MSEKIHKWTEYGLGEAPFRFVGVAQIPSPSLAEANPDAYNNAMRALPPGYHCGTCAVCGMPLMNNYLIKSADGRTFSVGCECVLKRGDRSLVDAVKAEERKRRREAYAIKKAAEREARMERRRKEREAKLEAERARNGGLTDEELRKRREDDLAARRWESLKPIAEVLADGRGGFRDSIAADMKRGQLPRGRGEDIVMDICAKMAGRRNSKAYNAEYDRIAGLLDKAEAETLEGANG